jgi:hypothetical protein
MSWLRATLIAVLALAVALGAVLVWLTRADLSFLKPQLESLVTVQTGRAFTIGGAFSLEVGRRTVVVAEDLRLGNAEWASNPAMARIGRARAEFDLFSLLRGPVLIHLIEVADAELLLEKPADHAGNWVISSREPGADDPFTLPIVGDVVIDTLSVTYIDPELEGPLKVKLDQARQHYDPESDGLTGSASGDVNGRPVQVSSQVSPLAAVILGADFDFEFSLVANAVTLAAQGHMDDLGAPRRPALDVRLWSPDVNLITNALGAEEFGDGALDLSVKLTPGPDAVTLTADGDLAGLKVSVNAAADDLSSLRESSLTASIQGPHFGRLMDVLGLEGLPDDPFQGSGQVERSGATLTLDNVVLDVGGTRLEVDGQTGGFPGIDAASLRLRLEGPDLGRFRSFLSLPEWAVGAFAVSGSIDHSESRTDELDVKIATALANVKLHGPIGDPPNYVGSELTLTASGRDLRALVTTTAAKAKASTMLEAIPAKPFRSGGRLAVSRREFDVSDAYLEIEDSRVDIEGSISRRADLVGSRITVTARGRELEDLVTDTAGLDFQPTPFEITGTVERLPGAVRLHEFRLAGESGNELRLNAELGLPFPGSREVQVDLIARGPDVSALPVQPQRFDLQPLPFEARLRGSLRDDRLTVETGQVSLGDADLDWRGTFGLPPELSATDSTLAVTIPDLASLGSLNGERLPAAPLKLHAQASGTQSTFRLDRLEAELGASKISGNMQVDVRGARPRVEAKVHLPLLEVPMGEGIDNAHREPPADGRLIPDVVVPLDRLTAMDGSFELTIDELRFGNVAFTQGFASAVLDDGALRVERFDVRPPSGRVQGSFTLRPQDGAAHVHFELQGDRVALNVAANTGPSAEPSNNVVFDLGVDLRARGATARELAATLNGHLSALSDGGRVYNRQLAMAFGGFGRELLGSINPFIRNDPYTDLSCVVVRLAATDGILNTDPYVAIRSDKLNLVTSGSANLATERIAFTFNALPRGRLSISATELINPYVRVSGTMLKPTLSLDSKGAAVTGGAAALTGGLSLIAQATWKRTFGSRDVCGKVLEEARAAEAAEKEDAAVTRP